LEKRHFRANIAFKIHITLNMGKSGFKKQTSTLFSLGLVKQIEKDEGSVQPLVSPLDGPPLHPDIVTEQKMREIEREAAEEEATAEARANPPARPRMGRPPKQRQPSTPQDEPRTSKKPKTRRDKFSLEIKTLLVEKAIKVGDSAAVNYFQLEYAGMYPNLDQSMVSRWRKQYQEGTGPFALGKISLSASIVAVCSIKIHGVMAMATVSAMDADSGVENEDVWGSLLGGGYVGSFVSMLDDDE
jgi:hypothetical protein